MFKEIILMSSLLFSINLTFAEDNLCDNVISQADINLCTSPEFSNVDKKLNATYAKLMNSLDEDHKVIIKKAQRAWIAFRDLECSAETMDSDGYSIHTFDVNTCISEMTKERIKKLESFISSFSSNR